MVQSPTVLISLIIYKYIWAADFRSAAALFPKKTDMYYIGLFNYNIANILHKKLIIDIFLQEPLKFSIFKV